MPWGFALLCYFADTEVRKTPGPSKDIGRQNELGGDGRESNSIKEDVSPSPLAKSNRWISYGTEIPLFPPPTELRFRITTVRPPLIRPVLEMVYWMIRGVGDDETISCLEKVPV